MATENIPGMCAKSDAHPNRDKRFHAAVMAGDFYCVFGIFVALVNV